MAAVPEENESYEELLEMNENLDKKVVEVSDESKEDINDLPGLIPRTWASVPRVVESVRTQTVSDVSPMDQWEREAIRRTSEEI